MSDAELIQLCQEMTVDEDFHERCPICEGLGIVNDAEGWAVQCPDCDGEGFTEI